MAEWFRTTGGQRCGKCGNEVADPDMSWIGTSAGPHCRCEEKKPAVRRKRKKVRREPIGQGK